MNVHTHVSIAAVVPPPAPCQSSLQSVDYHRSVFGRCCVCVCKYLVPVLSNKLVNDTCLHTCFVVGATGYARGRWWCWWRRRCCCRQHFPGWSQHNHRHKAKCKTKRWLLMLKIMTACIWAYQFNCFTIEMGRNGLGAIGWTSINWPPPSPSSPPLIDVPATCLTVALINSFQYFYYYCIGFIVLCCKERNQARSVWLSIKLESFLQPKHTFAVAIHRQHHRVWQRNYRKASWNCIYLILL